MNEIKIFLKKGKDESLKRFHPWVFSGAIARKEGQPEEGGLVSVYNQEGSFMGVGHWQLGMIAVRMLSAEKEPIDVGFWEGRFASALAVRESIGLTSRAHHDIYRLVYGEGDFMPGLIVDIYGKTAVMQAHSAGMHYCRHDLAQALKHVMQDRLDAVYYKSEATLPFKVQLNEGNGYILGNSQTDIATENGLRFHIDWVKGQKTGFFVDQRENRALLEHYARDRNVLNMFCYSGGFSVYAMRGGARKVVSVDSSQKAIDLANANVALNFPDDPRHEALAVDAFKYLKQMDSTYDLLILDPPAFSKRRDALRNALKGYTNLNAMALEKMPPGSILFTFSCSQAVSKEQFRLAVFTASAITRRRVRILHQLHQPADHPINIYHPEGEYLKGLVLYVE